MPVVRFVRPDGSLLAQTDGQPGDSLLDLARLADAPLHWRCGQGTCGTCKVRLLSGAAEGEQWPVGRKERNVMLRAGLVDAAAAGQESWPALRHWRLACHLALGGADWVVECEEP